MLATHLAWNQPTEYRRARYDPIACPTEERVQLARIRMALSSISGDSGPLAAIRMLSDRCRRLTVPIRSVSGLVARRTWLHRISQYLIDHRHRELSIKLIEQRIRLHPFHQLIGRLAFRCAECHVDRAAFRVQQNRDVAEFAIGVLLTTNIVQLRCLKVEITRRAGINGFTRTLY